MKTLTLIGLTKETDVIKTLPVYIPSKGLIAGYAKFLPPMGPFGLMKNDNFHYPMGTTYLTRGLLGVKEYAIKRKEAEEDPSKRDFYECIALSYDQIIAFFKRHIPELDNLLSNCEDENEKIRLTKIKDSFVRITDGKAETLQDALQLVFLMSRIRCLDWHADIGRLDQHLYPFYLNDVEKNNLSDDEAIDLLLNFYDRINEVGSGDTLINIMVGGTDENGNDVTNKLSILMLKAAYLEKGSEPHVNFRVNKNSPQEFLDCAYKVQSLGRGQCTMYNDEVIIPELIKHGVERKYACRYMNDGCTEIMLDGCDTIDFNHIDAVATFVLTMYDGRLPAVRKTPVPYLNASDEKNVYNPDVEVGYHSGVVEDCESFEEFYQCFKKQWQYQAETRYQEQYDQYLSQARKVNLSYFLNGTFEDVLQSGLGAYQGGLPKNTRMVFSGSIPTVADCLMAIKKYVYDEQKYSISQIKEACEANFEGFEVMRQELKNAPKFGNDIDEVDFIAKRIGDDFCDVFEKHYQETGYFIAPAYLGWRFVEEAHGIGATPDGRKYGDPISEHYCPTPGANKNGPTATLNSICKGSLNRAIGVAATHISLPAPGKDEGERAVLMCKALSEAAFKKNIVMLNLAIYDIETLRDAQIHPENHQDLIVRVWGFCARFVDLSEQMQNHIISRVS